LVTDHRLRYIPHFMEARATVVVDVGDVPVALSTGDPALAAMLRQRFRRFLTSSTTPTFHFDVSVIPEGHEEADPDADLQVRADGGLWRVRRGDFRAEWDPETRRGRILQRVSPYAADSVLRIVHTLLLSRVRGFLLHASSVVRNGRAFLFTGPSGSGKTTIARLAPTDAVVLTDEISYVRRLGDQYVAYGTPFAGELSDAGEPVSAPIAAVFGLAWAPDTSHERLAEAAAVRLLMRNILFFAEDPALIGHVFETACEFAGAVPAYRLAFAPDARVWSTIQ
jgi:hypothetical protein